MIESLAEIGARVRKCRVARDLTLRALARQLHVSPSYLSDIERGLRRPGFLLAAEIDLQLGTRFGSAWQRDVIASAVRRWKHGVR